MTHDDAPRRASRRGTNAEDLPDYLAVETPEDTDPKDYDTEQRRAEVLQIIFQAGSPKRINQTDLASRYGVHRTTIKRDIDAVAGDVAKHLGHRAELKVYAIFEKAIDELLDDDPREAWLTAKEFSTWLEDRGALDKRPDHVRVDANIRNVGDSDAYRVIEDDEVEAVEYIESEAGDS